MGPIKMYMECKTFIVAAKNNYDKIYLEKQQNTEWNKHEKSEIPTILKHPNMRQNGWSSKT